MQLSVTIPGDYNSDGRVDADDYYVWRSNFGSAAQLNADGNSNGIVDAADYTVWRNHVGIEVPLESTALLRVPEPWCLANCV